MILILDNYDSFTFNLYQYIEELGYRCQVVRNNKIDVAGVCGLRPQAVVISPGPGIPDEAGISLTLVQQLAGEVPILGVCLGHQTIGQAFGGKVTRAPQLVHGKVSEVLHEGQGVFKDIESPMSATRYHSLMVCPKSLPKNLEVTARTADGVIMGLRHREFPVEGVQFHPESILTRDGHRLLQNFLSATESL